MCFHWKKNFNWLLPVHSYRITIRYEWKHVKAVYQKASLFSWTPWALFHELSLAHVWLADSVVHGTSKQRISNGLQIIYVTSATVGGPHCPAIDSICDFRMSQNLGLKILPLSVSNWKVGRSHANGWNPVSSLFTILSGMKCSEPLKTVYIMYIMRT